MKQIYYILIAFSIVACTNNKMLDGSNLTFVESNCDTLLDIPFELDSIFIGMEAKLNDSIWSNFWMPKHNRIIDELTAIRNGTKKLFPYSDFDSTIFVFYEPHNISSANELETRTEKDISVLCPSKANALLNVINDPLNYSIGECGTAIPFSQVIFYLKNEEVGQLTFFCNYSAIGFIPENTMSLGDLNSRGDSLLDLVKPWN